MIFFTTEYTESHGVFSYHFSCHSDDRRANETFREGVTKGQKNHPKGELENSVELCVLRGESKNCVICGELKEISEASPPGDG